MKSQRVGLEVVEFVPVGSDWAESVNPPTLVRATLQHEAWRDVIREFCFEAGLNFLDVSFGFGSNDDREPARITQGDGISVLEITPCKFPCYEALNGRHELAGRQTIRVRRHFDLEPLR